MSVYERESFADFLHHVIRIRLDADQAHPTHDALLEGRANDEETVASIAADPDDAVRTRKSLRTIHTEFPYGASVTEQAAYLVRAFIGLDPFGDDDASTAWTYLRDLFTTHGWRLDAEPSECTAHSSHLRDRLNAHYAGGFQRRHVLDRDDVFSELASWFDRRLQPARAAPDQHL